jgi:TolA-binding protein
MNLRLGGDLKPFRVTRGGVGGAECERDGVFQGVLTLSLGPIDPNIEVPANAPQPLSVTGSDMIDVTVWSDEGQPVVTRTLKLVSDASAGLMDSSFTAERTTAHVGESFFFVVNDADRDATDEPDTVSAEAISSKTGVKRPLTLTETMPHSGVFTARLRPMMFAPGEAIPSVATGGVASAHEILTDDRFAIGYGDSVVFRYVDELTLPGTPAPLTLTATGRVFRGSNGDVRLFSKRFTDRDAAVLVQFRLAECLFEQAKEHRRLKQPEKSAADIAEGRFILEEALKNYPDSSHVAQGEFLLANLYQELATEAKDGGDEEKATKLYQEALSRFSQILGTWPEGEYAARSQYHKALCLEMLKDYMRASEEYVKMTYLYPESELVGDATIRLATYYYTQKKRYDISGHIYQNFQKRFPQHAKAARALFMAGSCYIKQGETIQAEVEKCRAEKKTPPKGWQARLDACYADAAKTFMALVEEYRDAAPAKLKAQALYWAGDVYTRRRDYVNAYRSLKRCVFEYPETEWARRARGLLLQEGRAFEGMD